MTFGQALAAAAIATTVNANDRIVVNLPTQKGADHKRESHTISETFDGAGYRLDGLGNRLEATPALQFNFPRAGTGPAKPVFPMAEYQRALTQEGEVGPIAQGINTQYAVAMAQWKKSTENGGMGARNVEDYVVDAVLAYAQRAYGVKTSQVEGLWIDPKQVNVKPPVRAHATAPATWSVTFTPVWGQR